MTSAMYLFVSNKAINIMILNRSVYWGNRYITALSCRACRVRVHRLYTDYRDNRTLQASPLPLFLSHDVHCSCPVETCNSWSTAVISASFPFLQRLCRLKEDSSCTIKLTADEDGCVLCSLEDCTMLSAVLTGTNWAINEVVFVIGAELTVGRRTSDQVHRLLNDARRVPHIEHWSDGSNYP